MGVIICLISFVLNVFLIFKIISIKYNLNYFNVLKLNFEINFTSIKVKPITF